MDIDDFRRDKILNLFSVMVAKRLKEGLQGEGEEDDDCVVVKDTRSKSREIFGTLAYRGDVKKSYLKLFYRTEKSGGFSRFGCRNYGGGR